MVASLTDEDDITNSFQKKIATSSQEDIVTAAYLGGTNSSDNMEDFQIEVQKLAKPQINVGNFLSRTRLDLRPDTYSFDLETNSAAYEFQFNVNPSDTNYDVQEKLANLITNASVGLEASVITDEKGLSSLRIESLGTGLNSGEEYLFNVTPQGNHNSMTALNVLGLGHVSQSSQNAEFLLNGTPRTSFTNTFSINRTFELTLRGISEKGNPATVGFKANIDAIADNIQTLVDSYNNILKTADKYSDSQSQSVKLFRDMSGAAFSLQNHLEVLGLMVNPHGAISIDKALLENAVGTEDPSESFLVLNDFKNLLDERASNASLDPMKYVDKVVVSYKNPAKTLVSPYITSIYSGMMMDQYC